MSAAQGWRPRVAVVTGGTKGIGRALCEALLERGCAVCLCARSDEDVTRAVRELSEKFQGNRVVGAKCDVSVYEDNVALWERCERELGAPDLWITNAGTSNAQRAFVELSPAEIRAVIASNFMGTVHGVRVASERMLALGRGGIYTMEGFGSDGASQRGMAVYGSTKRGLAYFTAAIAEELRGTKVIIGSLGPGVVLTDLLMDVYEKGEPALWERARFWFNFIADPPEVVAAWLADRVIENRVNGAVFRWMTAAKALSRFVQPKYYRRDLVGEAVNRRRDRTR